MRHRTKKIKIEDNMTEDNSYREAAETESIAVCAEEKAAGDISAEAIKTAAEPSSPEMKEELLQEKDKYLRLYAEFENYKKRIAEDREELIKYGNESLLYELLPVIDNLERAIQESIKVSKTLIL